ncbi:molybdopterin molybdotransferase MoeA [Arenibaculum pallidiluteum]|uniref:molybdopterin molybdotransferase MoeA n=1 Tax=Arenibaculum pallidiluteum TaxID=2812559 RepID=UPI001A959106|nr:gephyrin-like molybdotransferase Glp [Arenibaculum pallidiluteum]
MIPVSEALSRILSAFAPLPPETVALPDAFGRVLAADLRARVTQPPTAVSAMDGYAVRSADVANVPATLRCIGEAPAGRAFAGGIGPGECVRIFTGGPVPDGADAIVIQEDTDAEGERVTVREAAPAGRFVRAAGLDFQTGTVGLPAGRLMTARDIGLAAAMNIPWLEVRRRPRVAVLATGDEIARPGDPLGPNQIVSSNSLALGAMIRALGGEPVDLGTALDTRESLAQRISAARGMDLLLTTGGASVGDYDLVREVLGDRGLALDFYKIAMRPGKPLSFGRLGEVPVLGLPGNPVSAFVCGLLFLKPVLRRLQGLEADEGPALTARLGAALPSNDRRQEYRRATLSRDHGGELVATPFANQDSSVMSLLSRADCLIVRPPFAEASDVGERVEILSFEGGFSRL